jgi:hypothetical protein
MAIVQSWKRSVRSLVCLGLAGISTAAYAAVAQPQITQPVDNQRRITLHGNVRPMPRRARDLGAVDINTPASRVLLLLKRPAEQEAALQQYIAAAHSPGSPSYHRWLTPTQIGSQFGPAESDVQAVIAWLQSQGFAVGRVSAARTTIEFSGTAGQIQSAFATRIHSFQLDGVHHVSNVTNPQIPAALAPVIAGISPLNDFHPRPMHTAPRGRTAIPAPTSANPQALSVQTRTNQPELTVPKSNGTGNYYFVTPADAATIYNIPNSTLNKNHSGSLNLTGAGVTIGIAGDSNVDLSNVANYRALFLPGIASGTPKVVVDGNDPGAVSGDDVEALLDLEVAGGIAPGANINLYTAQDTTFQSGLFLAIQRALDDNQVGILNVSFGGCEAYQGQSGNAEILNFWEQAAAQGISVTVSTGDSGAAGCDNPNNEPSATQGLQVNGIGSTPFNIAVGGTDFNQTPANESQYWNTSNDTNIWESAKSYIPETPWNDSTSANGKLANNVPESSSGSTNISGAGGGVSGCLNATLDQNFNVAACADAYAKPSWQSGFGSGNARQIPDVSLFAASGSHDSAWVICASGVGGDNPGDVDCTKDSQGSFQFQVVGGTSASSPAFAGVLALLTQQLGGGRLGQVDYTLYPLSKQFPAAFHDITTGNISVVCSSSPASDPTACGSNGFLTGYDTATGYDAATGLGTLDVTQLIQNWKNVTAAKATTTSLTVNGSTVPVSGIVHGTPVSVAVTVSGSGGTPSGDVALVASGASPAAAAVQGTTASPSVLPLTNGAASDTSYTFLPGGSYSLTANYGGDGVFGSSVSNGVSVNVTPEASTLDLEIQDFDAATGSGAPVTSVPYGTYISVAAQPLSTAQVNSTQQQTYTLQAGGTVNFTSSAAQLNANNVPINSNGFAEIPNQLSIAYSPGTYNVTASYSGDASFKASTAAAQTFTVTKNNVDISSSSSGTTAIIEVDPASIGGNFFSSGFKLPTGTVTLTDSSGATVGTGTLMLGSDAQGFQVAQATVTISGTAANIKYSGDTNYNTGTQAFSGGGGNASFSLSSTPTTVTVPSGGSATTSIKVTPTSFTGTVTLICAVTGTGTPAPTCALAKASVNVSGNTAVSDTLTISTVSGDAAKRIAMNSSSNTWYAAGGAALAGILLFGLPGRRRAWQRMLGLMLLFVSIGVIGCGGGSSGGGGGGGTPAGNYTVTVTATSGSKTATTTITATVQ